MAEPGKGTIIMKKLCIWLLLAAVLSVCGVAGGVRNMPIPTELAVAPAAGGFLKPDVARIKKMAAEKSKKEKYPKVVLSGTCGKSNQDNVNYVMYRTGKNTCILQVSGKGRMEDFLNPEEDFLTEGESYVQQPLGLYLFHRPWDGSGYEKEYWNAVADCTRIEVGEGITSIGEVAFARFTNPGLKVSLPSTLTEIGSYAFALSELKEIEIPDSVNSIGDYAFAYSAIKEMRLPDSLDFLGEGVFCAAESLQKLYNWNDRLKKIPNFLMESSGIREFTIPDAVTKIGDYSFAGCENLSAIHWNDKVKVICDNAFSNTGIESMEIPDSVETVGTKVFSWCRKLKTIELGKNQKDTSLGYSFFHNCRMLEKVVIPDGVTEIEDEVFRDCRSLKTVVMPDGIVRIGAHAFLGCESLAGIEIPDSVSEIGDMAFADSGLRTVTLPDGIQGIGDYVFRNCSRLVIIRLGKNLKAVSKDAFEGCKSLLEIQAPEKQYKQYKELLEKPLADYQKVNIVKY